MTCMLTLTFWPDFFLGISWSLLISFSTLTASSTVGGIEDLGRAAALVGLIEEREERPG